MITTQLTPNSLAFLALANEYCQAIEAAAETDKDDFVTAMLRLLPRLYISATDLQQPGFASESEYIPAALDEEYYDAVRLAIERLMGEDDTYLEVFEDDMKFSDTPIGASVSESLADIFQALYNLTYAVKEAPSQLIMALLDAAKEDFESYWSRPLCNVLRALNNIRYR